MEVYTATAQSVEEPWAEGISNPQEVIPEESTANQIPTPIMAPPANCYNV